MGESCVIHPPYHFFVALGVTNHNEGNRRRAFYDTLCFFNSGLRRRAILLFYRLPGVGYSCTASTARLGAAMLATSYMFMRYAYDRSLCSIDFFDPSYLEYLFSASSQKQFSIGQSCAVGCMAGIVQ